MDVRIGEIDATIIDTEASSMDAASLERLVKRVMAAIDARDRAAKRAQQDRAISSPDDNDIEAYG